jgi:hypothetical protein
MAEKGCGGAALAASAQARSREKAALAVRKNANVTI